MHEQLSLQLHVGSYSRDISAASIRRLSELLLLEVSGESAGDRFELQHDLWYGLRASIARRRSSSGIHPQVHIPVVLHLQGLRRFEKDSGEVDGSVEVEVVCGCAAIGVLLLRFPQPVSYTH